MSLISKLELEFILLKNRTQILGLVYVLNFNCDSSNLFIEEPPVLIYLLEPEVLQ